MIKTSDFNKKISLLTLNQSLEMGSMSKYRFVPYVKVRAAVNQISSGKVFFNTRRLKNYDEIQAVEWNNKIFQVISMKSDRQFCSYVAEDSG